MKKQRLHLSVLFLLIAIIAGSLMSCDFMFSSELVYVVEDMTGVGGVAQITYTDFFGADKTVTVDLGAPMVTRWELSLQVFRGRIYRLSIPASGNNYSLLVYRNGSIAAWGDRTTPISLNID